MTKALGTVTEFLQICGNVYTNKNGKISKIANELITITQLRLLKTITISLNYSIISIFPCNVFTYKQTFQKLTQFGTRIDLHGEN